ARTQRVRCRHKALAGSLRSTAPLVQCASKSPSIIVEFLTRRLQPTSKRPKISKYGRNLIFLTNRNFCCRCRIVFDTPRARGRAVCTGGFAVLNVIVEVLDDGTGTVSARSAMVRAAGGGSRQCQWRHKPRMADLTAYAASPLAFVFRYIRLRPVSHATILAAVLGAVACSVCTQYGVKFLVDTLSSGADAAAWTAFFLLGALIAADNLLWRVAAWIANYAFVGVTGDLRRDLFSHLLGHSPSYFSERLPGMLTSRVTATSNAMFTAENMFMWNVLPPCVATVAAIALVLTISLPMAATLAVIAGIMVLIMFRLAAAGRPLHHDFARKAAAVDGEMIDVVNNMSLVRAFGGFVREHRRFDATINREMAARRRSLFYLEKLRIFHAVVTILLTLGLVAWAIMLWQRGQATTGDVVLACTLALSVLNATRDLAVALVDITQHIARLSEAVATLLVPHELRDDPQAAPLVRRGASVKFEDVDFTYPDGQRIFDDFSLNIMPGERVGLVGHSGGGKSTVFALLQRFYDVQSGQILLDGQNIA